MNKVAAGIARVQAASRWVGRTYSLIMVKFQRFGVGKQHQLE
ncbi:hypothetical protein F441_14785 [Phytophthora nicotianae CJ01A1]|uniref:Uncharacterized protein n=6 Tax=Phytophthora nicotianae TaxID=4792 RepID=W2PSX1_PHYN3|nr:hypothetical protein PPTG_23688 [Phytophthora nicotianae INRA-310]ETI39450.1 hypothetical protein F443_14976 [Phytophthora nicotianae P1569]ETK79613.1 hypothetical protein L915_14541 [Phytophthora nicotianae]ETO68187.1 hypothetical protein F444_14961 [Phytophthora nicotianae P1976]ETP09339.1 hypothetical protein F441_14785 [Phytophthora nicotianae CJ01A1]ETP37378.1 hypothetical protein F442_14811 [Phytophthora nicotianae P10297]